MEDNVILTYKTIIYVPKSTELRKLVMNEMHNVPYAGNPRYQKTIAAVRIQHFWLRMK